MTTSGRGVFGARKPTANHLLLYEKEFAINEDSPLSKLRFSGDHGDLLPGRTAEAADAAVFGTSICLPVPAYHLGAAAGAGGLVSR